MLDEVEDDAVEAPQAAWIKEMSPQEIAHLQRGYRIRVQRAVVGGNVASGLYAADQPLLDPKGIDLLHGAAEAGALSERALHMLLHHHFMRREYDEMNALIADESLGHETLRSYHRHALAKYMLLPEGKFAPTLAAWRAADPGSLTRIAFQHLLLIHAAQEEAFDWIMSWVEAATDRDIAGIPPRTLFAIVGTLNLADRRDDSRLILDRALPHLSAATRLSLLLPARDALGPDHEPDLRTQNDVLDRLTQVRHDALHGAPDPVWDWLLDAFPRVTERASVDLMGMREDPDQMARFGEVIDGAIRERRPFSYLRLCDGESFLMDVPEGTGIPEMALRDDAAHRMRNWWGEVLPPREARAIAERVWEAFRDCDAMGVCTIHRFVRDAIVGQPYGENINDRSMVQLFHAMDTIMRLDGKIALDERANQKMFTAERIQEICAMAERVVFVGCWTKEQLRIPAEVETTWVLVRPRDNMSLDMPEGTRSILRDYDEIAGIVRDASGPGTVLLLAAGYASKGLCKVARDAGAVALDVGSAADRIAGAHTRALVDQL